MNDNTENSMEGILVPVDADGDEKELHQNAHEQVWTGAYVYPESCLYFRYKCMIDNENKLKKQIQPKTLKWKCKTIF